MSSELIIYSENTFVNYKVIYYIASNIAYNITNNKEYKSIYFQGCEKMIQNFIKILKYMCNWKYLIIDKKSKKSKDVKDEKYTKIFINCLEDMGYLTNNDSIILFKDNYTLSNFENISKQFWGLVNKIVNHNLRNGKNFIYSEELVFGENYNLLLYSEYIYQSVISKGKTEFNLNGIYHGIYSNFSLNSRFLIGIKEYLIIMFGKPIKNNEWKISWKED